jgi:hypothetical protein
LDPAHPIPSWSVARKLGFRFAFVYWLLFALPFPLDLLPWTDWIVGPIESGQRAFVLWTARHVLGLGEVPSEGGGSGDTAYDYEFVFCALVLALAGALVWSILDRKRASYARLADWLWAYVRLDLATAMISYGSYKVIPSQFPVLTLDRLAQPFGEASPMGLLWTFMGTSAPYQIFSGAGELLGGLLLFQRRTAVLGAIVATGVMAQVVMLNFAFDVPVKLYSAHLLAIALFLLLPHVCNLFGQFVLGRPAAALGCARLFQRPALHRGALALRTLFLVYIAWQRLSMSYDVYREYSMPPPTPFDGAWRVAAFETEPPEAVDPGLRWTELVVGSSTRIGVTHASGVYERLQLELGEEGALSLTRRGDPQWKSEFTYEMPAPERLRWNGTLDGKSVHIDFERRPARDYLLQTRGFHWINEVPFNR